MTNDHLDDLEAEGIHILREAVAERKNPVLLFSGGKDSAVVLRLAEKAFRPGRFPKQIRKTNNIRNNHQQP